MEKRIIETLDKITRAAASVALFLAIITAAGVLAEIIAELITR